MTRRSNGRPRAPGPPPAHGMLLSTAVMAAGIVLLSVLIARWLTRPIRKMAAAVHALNTDSEFGQDP